MIEFDFKNKTRHKIFGDYLEDIVNKFSKSFYPSKDIQVSLTIVGDAEIRKLNKEYFEKDKTTDVISLESKGKIEPQSLGEIIICGDVAERQAKERKHSLQKEIETLFCHGLIHLLGKDHDSNNQQKNWNKILIKLRKET